MQKHWDEWVYIKGCDAMSAQYVYSVLESTQQCKHTVCGENVISSYIARSKHYFKEVVLAAATYIKLLLGQKPIVILHV